jgi:hypothetical protein
MVVARCTGGGVDTTPPAGADVAGALARCAGDFVAPVVRCAGVVRGAVSAGVESTGCAGDCAVDFLAAVAVVLARGAERVRGAASDGAAGAVLVASVTFWVGTTGAVLSEAAAVDADVVVRRLTTGFTSCSAFSPGSAVEALAGLERVLVRLLVAVGFTCSAALVSGDSDVFLMKKTPFYRMMRHKRCRKSHFTATKKYCRLLR